MEDKEQLKLFEIEEDWRKEWKDMPEFVQEDLRPFKTIMVHFENIEAIERFSKITEQTVTLQTKSIWYPKVENEELRVWVDADNTIDKCDES